jgi:predicted phage terminase large subunit-like protein
VCKACGWEPTVGPQLDFIASSAYEALYGGAAGGGKSESLLYGVLRDIADPFYRAILFRRTYPELKKSLIDRSQRPYRALGGTYNGSDHAWRFPSGAMIYFSHLEHEHSVESHQSSEYQFIGFDELTHFTELQYTYMLSRLRGSRRVRVRAGTNPGGPGHDWVFKRWAPWLNRKPDYKGVRVDSGKTLFYRNVEGEAQWCERGPGVLSRLFIQARVEDNPHITDGSPQYVEQLKGLDAVNRARLLGGDWLAQPGAGAYYQRGWFRFLDTRPVAPIARVRRWDLASTENGGDWTVGVRMALLRDRSFVVEDVVRKQLRPAGVEACILSTAELDGKDVHVSMPQDPGQAGKSQVEAYAKLLSGYVFKSAPETGDKVTRQEPFSAQCEAGNVSIVRGHWNEPFLQTLEAFPDPGVHDDDVDAAAGAFTYLAGKMSSANYLRAMENLTKESR